MEIFATAMCIFIFLFYHISSMVRYVLQTGVLPDVWRPPRHAWRRAPITTFVYTFMLLPLSLLFDICDICCWLQVPVMPIGILWIYYTNSIPRYEISGDPDKEAEFHELTFNSTCVYRTPKAGFFQKTYVFCPNITTP